MRDEVGRMGSASRRGTDPGASALRKVLQRLLPFTMLLFFFSLIDRTNISFAALQMNDDLGFGPTVYGFAAGIFFVGYCLFEVPSNLVLMRVGARPWLARIMLTWGVIVVATAWVNGLTSLYTMRFLLGVAEAGLLPGLFYYLGTWIPASHRGLGLSVLMSTAALSNVIGGPLATGIMELDGWLGFRGWQLVFLLEGVPTVLVGIAVLAWLPETPRDARWLEPAERDWLESTIARENAAKARVGAMSLRQGFTDRRVLIATVFSFCLVCCNFGTVFWLPQILKSLGSLSNLQVGQLSVVPYLLGGIGMILWGRHSDRGNDRRWHLVASGVLATIGYALAGLASTPAISFLGLCLATLGVWSMFGVFWAIAADLLAGAAAAAGLAFINSVGTLGGFVAPLAMGYLRDVTGTFTGSLLALAAFAAFTALLAPLLYVRPQEGEAAPS
jgi:ACS family tartrate transporter-like MFS transporter